MRFSKGFRITGVIIGAATMVAIGVLLANKTKRANSQSKSDPASNASQDSAGPAYWLRVELEDGIALYVPSFLRSAPTYQTEGYWRFRSLDSEILVNYGLTKQVAVCAVPPPHAPPLKFEPISVDAKEARIHWLDKTAFNVDDDESLAVKGFLICVPNVGDNTHAFSVVGKYRSAQDYQTLERVIDSIRFPG